MVTATTVIGILLSASSKNRVLICRELVSFCDMLSVDISFRNTPVTEYVSSLLENSELSAFLYSLGKSDSKSQLKLINAFREYIRGCETNYAEKYSKDSRLLISFGFFGGLILSLVLI